MQRPQWLQAFGSMTRPASVSFAAPMGQFFSTAQVLQVRHFSDSKAGTRWPMMPKSFRSGFTQLFGQPPRAILNLWGSSTPCQPS